MCVYIALTRNRFSENRWNFLKRRIWRRFRALRARKSATQSPLKVKNPATLATPLGKWTGVGKWLKSLLYSQVMIPFFQIVTIVGCYDIL